MGIFSNKCEKCGHTVKKRARFCSKCGEPAPKGWSKCGTCDKWVGVESEFCPHCKSRLHPEERKLVTGNIINRPPEAFLQRIEVADIRRNVKNFLIIQPGTAIVVLKDAKVSKVIEAGKYSLKDGIFASIFSSAIKSILLVDSGEIILPFQKKGLRSKEDMELSFYTESVFQFNLKRIDELINNLMKDSRQVTYQQITEVVERDVSQAVKNLTNSTNIDDLIKSSDVRSAFEDSLADVINKTSKHLGIEEVRVAAIQFYGEDYEELRKKSGDIEIRCRENVLKKRLRDAVRADEMDEIKSDNDLKMYEEQLLHEYGVSRENMEHEMQVLKQVHNHEIDKKDGLHQLELEDLQFTQGLDQQDRTHNQELKETEDWLKIKQQKQQITRDDQKAKLEMYSKHDIKEMIAALPEEEAQRLLKFKQQDDKKLMTPEERLAVAAESSPEAAKALAAMMEAENKGYEEREKIIKENSDRLEKIMEKALDANAEVAKNRSNINR
ncbi:MAG: SPFH domain-containing protein [Verrucomicrobiota bacterium]|nr:SPFH domain-containing protein [Verrucomicrobiota bacterium]